MVTEDQIKNSFRLVKNDILKMQEELFVISSTQSDILRKLEELSTGKVKSVSKKKPKKKAVKKPAKKKALKKKKG